MRVAIYARVSSERQAERDLSIPSQLKALRRYAADKGWEVVSQHVDEAESARTANRPAFQEMIARVKSKERPFEAILVWKLSRFARNREDSILYKSLLRRRGISVISINEPMDDGPAGHLLEGIIEVVDEFYSLNLSQDTVRGMRENAGRGYFNGGRMPYGYRTASVKVGSIDKTQLVPDDVEAPVVQRIFQFAMAGRGGKAIAMSLTIEGVRTRSGNMFSATTINNILKNEAYTGTLVWGRARKHPDSAEAKRSDEVVRYADAHPALVARADFEAVANLLKQRRPAISHPRTVSSQFLLSGLLQCGRCGSAMIGSWGKSGKYLYYVCNRRYKQGRDLCASGLVRRDRIEQFVLDRLRQNVLTDENLGRLVELVNQELSRDGARFEERLDAIEQQLQQVGKKLARLYAALETGKAEVDDLAPRIKELRVEQRALQETREGLIAEKSGGQAQRLAMVDIAGYVSDLRALLESAPFLERKASIKSFVGKVTLDPGRLVIDYTIPVPCGLESTNSREVLPINKTGSPSRCLTRAITHLPSMPMGELLPYQRWWLLRHDRRGERSGGRGV